MRSEGGTDNLYWQIVRWLLTSVVVVPLGLLLMAYVGFGVFLFMLLISPLFPVLGGIVVGACLGGLVGMVHERWAGRSVLIWAIIGFALGLLYAIYGNPIW